MVPHIAAVSPPRPGIGIPTAILFAMDLCSTDVILNLGGVQGVAAMANSLFGLPKADILVGPGNQYVAKAKRILYGQVGIDMFAGPTDSMVIADGSADAEVVAAALVGQAEHGYNFQVWLVTTDRGLADRVMARVPGLTDALPELSGVALSSRTLLRSGVALLGLRLTFADVTHLAYGRSRVSSGFCC